MSEQSDSFNATGSVVAFETLNDNNQAFGVSVTGSQCGVYGESSRKPVGTRPPTLKGVGVAGRGDLRGVIGDSENIGVEGGGGKEGIGVRGGSESGVGVHGESHFGDGVKGKNTFNGRGGVFESTNSAQVQLVPHELRRILSDPVVLPVVKAIAIKDGPALPRIGHGGDLMAVIDGHKNCTLWFCVRQNDGETAAQWTQVLLGPQFAGRV